MTPLSNDHRNPLGNASIPLLIVLGFGLVMAVFLGLTIGSGDMKKVYIMGLALVAFPVFLFLGDKYWMLLPFAMTVSLPAIPIVGGRSVNFGELWVVASAGAFILRVPFMANKFRFFKADYIPVLLYVGWAAFIYKINGAGLAILGSSTVGGRSYLTIALAVAAFFLLCNQRLEEKQAKWIVLSIVFGAFLSSAWGIFAHFKYPTEIDVSSEQSFYTWHQHLSGIALYVVAYVFARFSPMELLARFHFFWTTSAVLCYGLVTYSGKRAALFACLLFPLLSAWMRKRYGFIFVALLVVSMGLTILVLGHNRAFRLPQTVQRALWIFPGEWDYTVKVNTSDTYRRTLNRLALKQIHDYPIIGRGFGFTSLEAWLATDPNAIARIAQQGDHFGAFIMAAGGEWHSTWLGIAATMGIPGAILWGFVWVQSFVVAFWVVRHAPPGSYVKILATILFFFAIMDLTHSWTSGHAARNLWSLSWRLGILLVMKWQIQEAARATIAEAEPARVPARVRRGPLRGPMPPPRPGPATAPAE